MQFENIFNMLKSELVMLIHVNPRQVNHLTKVKKYFNVGPKGSLMSVYPVLADPIGHCQFMVQLGT